MTRVIFFFALTPLLFCAANLFAFGIFRASIFELIFYTHRLFGELGETDFYFSSLSEHGASFLPYLPEAMLHGIFLPLPWQVPGFFPMIEALGNCFVLGMTVWLIYTWMKNKTVEFWQIALFLNCFASAVAFAYSTPNWGTLARYKVYYMPTLYFLFFYEVSKMPRMQRILGLVV